MVHTEASMTDTAENSRNIIVDSITVSSEDGAADTTDHGNGKIILLLVIFQPLMHNGLWFFIGQIFLIF